MKNMIGTKFLYPYDGTGWAGENRLWEVKEVANDYKCEIIGRGFEGITAEFTSETIIMGELVLKAEEQVQTA